MLILLDEPRLKYGHKKQSWEAHREYEVIQKWYENA